MRERFLRAARGEPTDRPPVWLMRQAGRHLPEYRELRAEHSFVEAVRTPDIAAELSLQPWERYGVDGVVMFSDILVALEPLGFEYRVESGVGPVVEEPIEGPGDVDRQRRDVRETLDYVGALLGRLREAVGEEAAVIGFAGGPFTLASYAVAGESTRNQLPLRRFRVEHERAFEDLLGTFADVVRTFLEYQIEAGADVVQLFDTYASVLTPADYRRYIEPLHARILDGLDAPTILFVRDMAGRLEGLAAADPDVVGLDWHVEMGTAREILGDRPVQGNLDPSYLYADPSFVKERTREIIEAAGPAGHILNLGHGVHRDTPIEGVEALVEAAKSVSR